MSVEYVRQIRSMWRPAAESKAMQDWLKEACLDHASLRGMILTEPQIRIVGEGERVTLEAFVEIEEDEPT